MGSYFLWVFSFTNLQTFLVFLFSWEMGLICYRTLISHLYYGFFSSPSCHYYYPSIIGRLPFFPLRFLFSSVETLLHSHGTG